MNDTLNQWIAFIDDYDRGLIKMAEDKNKTLKKARIEMNYLTGDAEMQRLADLREKWEMEYSSLKAYATEEGMKEGMQKGMQEGMKEGMKQGIKEGIKKGIKEGIVKTAKNLLKLGMSIEQIEEVTGLTEEEIKKL